MTRELFSQLVLNGFSLGMIYVLVASGLILLLGVVRIFNFAHGEFYMLGAFITFGLCSFLHLNYFLSIGISVVIVGLLSVLAYKTIFQYMRGDILRGCGASIGISMILQRAILLGYGTQERGLRPPIVANVGIGSVHIPLEKALAIVFCIAVMIGLYLLLQKTKVGKAMRAVKLDSECASLQGINPNIIYAGVFTMGCALAAMAGGIVAPIFAITPSMGDALFLKCLMVLMVGGMESMVGAVVGGVIIGIITSFGAFYMGGLSEALLFGVIGVILVFKPNGVFGEAH